MSTAEATSLKSQIVKDETYNGSDGDLKRFALLKQWLDDPEHAQIELAKIPHLLVIFVHGYANDESLLYLFLMFQGRSIGLN